MRKKISILFLLALFMMSSGFGCKINNQANTIAQEPITLTYWRVFDGPDAFEDIINKYRQTHPHINIEYRKLRYEEYEGELLNALAEDRGPDIFSIHNTWIRKYKSKIEPMPESTTLPYPVTGENAKDATTYAMRTIATPSLRQIKDNFVDVVSYDVILEDNKVYGLPLSVDTLAMFFNKDLLNNSGISEAPLYWNRDFLQAVKKLTKQDPKKGVVQAGVAMGGSDNIERFSDILSLLMMQNGAIMLDDNLKVTFNQIPDFASETNYNPGLEALRFYTDFANPAKESYSWNNELEDSLQMFISGNLAMMFGYSYHIPVIKASAPKLNFSIVKFPQIEGTPPTNINFANYWVETVSKKSKNKNEAWNFIQFMTEAEQVKSYLEKAEKPTALRSLISEQRNDDVIGVFADQVLTAKSWYKGANPEAAELAFKQMIDAILMNQETDIKKIINSGAAKVQQTIY